MQSDLHRELQEAVGDVYAVERELARGGMSRVFLATERSLGRRVVIKVLAPDLLSGIGAARFRREIEITANLQHPHILPVLAVGTSGHLHYFVTPYVAGESLRARLKKGAVPVSDAMEILQELSAALSHAHERGVVHRDVKPGNVLLSDGHAILADFGIASALDGAMEDERLTGTGHRIGTPGYMAPEQLAGDAPVDARADVFALGVLGYEMLAGSSPFDDPTQGGLGVAYFTGPRPLQKVRPEIPREVATAISRAMAPHPADRFTTATEFCDALRPLTSSHGTRRLRASRSTRFTIATLATLLLVSGLAALGSVLLPRLHARPDTEVMRLAVLPFKNLGPPQNAYFADGVTEELTSRLASLEGIGVISRTSADRYRDSRKSLRKIARELGANYVLEGSVRWERLPDGRGRVRVTPQLIRVADDNHLWTKMYDAELNGVFEAQSRIAEDVASAVPAALSASDETTASPR